MKVILIDAMHLAHRMQYTHDSLQTSSGQASGVLHGVLSNVLALQERFGGWSIVFCWDEGLSWRAKLTPLYKANRYKSAIRVAVDSQITILQKELLDVVGIRQVSVDSIEGDDVVGLLSEGLRQKKDIDEVLIYSGDKDFYQLVDDKKVRILCARKQEFELIDGDSVRTRYGISPKDWNKFRALAGDSSDGMKALKDSGMKVGAKTAALLLGFGIDPSQPNAKKGIPKNFRVNDPRGKFAELGKYWDKIHLCYRMSIIPRSVGQIEVAPAVRSKLEDEVRKVVSFPSRLMRPGIGKEFLANLVKYELAYCMGKRRQFWLIP